ncbi:MAG: sodium-dependent transporter [Verrucomicrobiales bacterium]|nr:sodium-dependent transporter [Verrucomicrobiales bacterium]
MSGRPTRENWSSRLGVILAVAGSAVGLGNFLRFPGQAAQYGGGAFMVAYVVSFLIIGLPIAWAEWALGRRAGQKGFNSCPGILFYITRHPAGKFIGVIGVIIPVVVYMYYVCIEAWCLGYAVNFLKGGTSQFEDPAKAGAFFGNFVGMGGDGSALKGFGMDIAWPFLIVVFILNFVLIYRGLSKGIELFCKYAMPALVVIALVVLVRVLTLGTPVPAHPENSVINGLGYMWNPQKTFLQDLGPDGKVKLDDKGHAVEQEVVDRATIAAAAPGALRQVTIWEQLQRRQLWLAAAGQIFFSLSVGFGVIITYASYLKRNDDVVLSGLAACSANEFCEVGLGGLITLPAGVAFLGVAGVAGQGTFGLGFNVLPVVFHSMPGGAVFGFLFFFLLFLAAVTSSLSMLQPGIAFLEESLGVGRKVSVTLLGLITLMGCGFVMNFSAGLKALDTIDFWIGTFLMYVLATIQIIIFSWILGVDKGLAEANRGAAFKIPGIFRFFMMYLTPIFLIVVFLSWLTFDVLGLGGGELSSQIKDLFVEWNPVSWMSVGLIAIVGTAFLILSHRSEAFKTLPAETTGDEPDPLP